MTEDVELSREDIAARLEAQDMDELDELIYEYRTDIDANYLGTDRKWIHEALILLATRDHLLRADIEASFTLVDVYYTCKHQAKSWDAMFGLEPPFNIGVSFTKQYYSVASFNTMFLNWARGPDPAFIKTGEKIKSVHTAIVGAKQVAYIMEPEVVDADYLKEFYRERLVDLFERLPITQKAYKKGLIT